MFELQEVPSYILIGDKRIEVYDICMSGPNQMNHILFPNIFSQPHLNFRFIGTPEDLSDIPYNITLVMGSREFLITNVRISQTASSIFFPESAAHGNIETTVEMIYDECYISSYIPKTIRGFFADII